MGTKGTDRGLYPTFLMNLYRQSRWRAKILIPGDLPLGLLDDLVESVLGPLAGVHLVASNDELPDTEGEGEQSVLSGLTILLESLSTVLDLEQLKETN
jgi:hypothetical protein